MISKNQIEKEFLNVTGLNEAKKIFKKLARLLHPDVGGSEEEFKILKNVYDEIVEHKIYFSNETKFDIELEKIISQILHFENIVIEVIGSWMWLSGSTKVIKSQIKDLGFKWASKKKMWYYGEMKGKNPKQKSMNDIKSKYGCTTLRSQQKKKLSA